MVVPAPMTASSSTVSSRPNPNSRNSETRDPMRRSFTGNPFSKPSINTNIRGLNPNTPVNTPSDTPRRNSMSRENVVISFREVEDPENGKDPNQKAAKLPSPAATKGTKNFMSPTISAASKFSASPKKKILVERNEPARASFSLSESKNLPMEAVDPQPDRVPVPNETESLFGSTITDEKFKEAMKCELCPDIKLPLVYRNELESSMEAVTGEADLDSVEPSFKISTRPPSASLAPLDADPQMPPYDPKNNYLSPRPQFLHYKPNPRIELFLKGNEAKQLEESFVLESSSDKEVTEESQSENSEKEPESMSSNENIEEEEENEEDGEELYKTELPPIGRNTPKGTVEAKGVSKPRFFARLKFFAFLLFVAVTCFVFSANVSPVKYPSVFKDFSFSKLHAPPVVTKIAKANLDQLAHNLRPWPATAKSYISELILTLRGMHKESPSQFNNLTDLIEDHLLDWYQLFDHKGLETEKKNEPIEVKPKIESAAEILMLEGYEDMDYVDEDYEVVADRGKDIQDTTEIEDSDYVDEGAYKVQAGEEIEKQGSLDNVLAEDIEPKFEEVNITAQVAVIEKLDSLDNFFAEDREPKLEEVNITAQIAVIEKLDDLDNFLAEDREPKFEVVNITAQVAVIERHVPAEEQTEEIVERPATKTRSNIDLEAQVCQHMTPSEDDAIRLEDGHGSSETDVWMETPQTSEKMDLTNMLRYKFLLFDLLGYILLLLSLVTAKVFLCRTKKAGRSPIAEIRVGHAPVPNKMADGPKSVNVEYNFQEISSRICQKEAENVGEPCRSEVSSLQKSSSYNKKSLRLNETQSNEKRPTKSNRRESYASSDYSMGSPSYGSFTTYEKIPCKNGDEEEEIVTPVRRSSRIRKQVASP